VFGEDRLAIPDLAARSNASAAINGGFGHGGPAIGIDERGMWYFRMREGTRWLDEWDEVVHALAGGHMFILNGEILPAVEREEYTTAREINHAGRIKIVKL